MKHTFKLNFGVGAEAMRGGGYGWALVHELIDMLKQGRLRVFGQPERKGDRTIAGHATALTIDEAGDVELAVEAHWDGKQQVDVPVAASKLALWHVPGSSILLTCRTQAVFDEGVPA